MQKSKLVSISIFLVVLLGYATPLMFSTWVTGDSPIARDNLLPRSKLSSEQDNVDSFNVHPAYRWNSDESAGITSSIDDGNLKVVTPTGESYQMDRQLFESDGDVEYRYGADYYNDSLLNTFPSSFSDFGDEWFDNTYSDINDWSEGDLEGWVSNETLSLFANSYLKIIKEDGTYYYKDFESLFEGHLPDPRSTPFGGVQYPKSDLDDSDGGTVHGNIFTIPEGQEWLLSYLAFNLGQYDGVYPCINIGWCLPDPLGEGTEHAYDQSGASIAVLTSIHDNLPSYGQLFEVPEGEVWNITSSGTWFYYASAFGQDFFVYDSEYADPLDFSEWDFETLEVFSGLSPLSYYVTDNLTETNSQWILDDFNPSHAQIFEIPTEESWTITEIGYALTADRSGTPEGLIGITETINGSYISEGGSGADVISYIPDWDNVLTSAITETTGHLGIGTVAYETWSVPTVTLSSGIYAWFWNDTILDGSSYYLKYDGVDAGSNQTNDFFAQDGTSGWLGEGGAWWWDYFPVINYSIYEFEFFTDELNDNANFLEDSEGFTSNDGDTLVVQLNNCFTYTSGCLNVTNPDGESPLWDSYYTKGDNASQTNEELSLGNTDSTIAQIFQVPYGVSWNITGMSYPLLANSGGKINGTVGITGATDYGSGLEPDWSDLKGSLWANESGGTYPTFSQADWDFGASWFILTTGYYAWFFNVTEVGTTDYKVKLDNAATYNVTRDLFDLSGGGYSVYTDRDFFPIVNVTIINPTLGHVDFKSSTGLSIDADLYKYLAFSFYGNSTGEIDQITISDSSGNSILNDTTGWDENVWNYVIYELNASTCAYYYCDLDAWTGTETNFSITMDSLLGELPFYFDYIYLQSNATWNKLLLDRQTTDPNGNTGGFLSTYISNLYESVFFYNKGVESVITRDTALSGDDYERLTDVFIVPEGENWFVTYLEMNMSSYGSFTADEGEIGIYNVVWCDAGSSPACGGVAEGWIGDWTDPVTNISFGAVDTNLAYQRFDVPDAILQSGDIYAFNFRDLNEDDGNYYEFYQDNDGDNRSRSLIGGFSAGWAIFTDRNYFYKIGYTESNLTAIWNPNFAWDAGIGGGSPDAYWINADLYKNLTLQVMPVNVWDGFNENNASALDIIENMTIYDYNYNPICFTDFSSTVLENGTWYDVQCSLNDSVLWTGKVRGIYIEFGLQVALDSLGDAIWLNFINITANDMLKGSIGVVGINSTSGFPDFTNVKGYTTFTEDDVVGTAFTYNEIDFGSDWFILQEGSYYWFMNHTAPSPSPDTNQYQWKVYAATNTTFYDVYLSPEWQQFNFDLLPNITYTLQLQDYTPRGEIGIAGLYDAGHFDSFDKDNIYWNGSIGNLATNNSWNYFPIDETIILSAGTYVQYLNVEGDFADCGTYSCSGSDPRRLYPNGYIFYSDQASPEDQGYNSDDDERYGIYHQGRYVLYSPSDTNHDYYLGLNYTEVYNCASDCVGEYTDTYWNHTYLNDNFNVEIDSPELGRNSVMQTFEVPIEETWRISRLGNEKMYRWGDSALTGIIGIVSASIGTCAGCGYWTSGDLNVYLPDWDNILTSQTFTGSEVSLSSDYKYWDVPTVDLIAGTYLWFVNVTNDVSGTAALGFDGEQNPATNNTRDYFGWGSAAGGWFIEEDGSVYAYWDLYVAINYTLITTFYFNDIFPLIEEFSNDFYQPKWETSTFSSTQDLNNTDSIYSTFRVPESETWVISSLSIYAQMVNSPTAEWFITELKQCVWTSTCNDWTGLLLYEGFESAMIPDISNILANGTSLEGFDTGGNLWQNMTLAEPVSLTEGAYAIVFTDTSIDDDSNYFNIWSDRDQISTGGINVTQTGRHNITMGSDYWYIEIADILGAYEGKDLRFQIHYNNTEVNATQYNLLTMYFNSNVSVSSILINDFDGNQLCSDSTGWTALTTYLFKCDLSDGSDWFGLEQGLQFNFTTATNAKISISNTTIFNDYSQIKRTGLSITAADYTDLLMRFNNTDMLSEIEIFDTVGNVVYTTYNREPDYRHELIGFLDSASGWTGTEDNLTIRFTWNVTEPITNEPEILLDYLFLYENSVPLEHDVFEYINGNEITFNDGSLEGFYSDDIQDTLSNPSTFLRVIDGTTTTVSILKSVILPTFSGDVYTDIYFRVRANVTITGVGVADADDNGVCFDSVTYVVDTWNNYHCTMDLDGDWTSSETGVIIRIYYAASTDARIDYDEFQITNNATQQTYQDNYWYPFTYGSLENRTDVVMIPNGTNTFLRFYLYPNTKDRQIANSNITTYGQTGIDYYWFLKLENFTVNSGTNSLVVGFNSSTSGINWIDFNTSIWDSDLTDAYHFNDINTTSRTVQIPLHNVTGWEGSIQALYINITDWNDEQYFDIRNISLTKTTVNHTSNIVYGFWDKVNDKKVLDVKHNLVSYFDWNASFTTEITLYNSTLGVAANYTSPLVYFDATTASFPYFRVYWEYDVGKTFFAIAFADDGNNDLWRADFGTDFTIYDPNPKLFDSEGQTPLIYYNVTVASTDIYGGLIAYTDYIEAQFKDREWNNYYNNITNPKWSYQSPYRQVGNASETDQSSWDNDFNITKYRLSISNLDSISATVSQRIDTSASTSDANCITQWFHMYNVKASDAELKRIFKIQLSGCADSAAGWGHYVSIWSQGAIVYQAGSNTVALDDYTHAVEFSVATRDDRRFVDINFRYYNDTSVESTVNTFISVDTQHAQPIHSQEFVIETEYSTWELGLDAGVRFDMRLASFQFTKAGWLEDIAVAVLSPILGVINSLLKALWDIFVAIFTPLIMFLAWILSLALAVLGTIFKIAIDGLGVILDGLGGVLDVIFSILGDILDELVSLFGTILGILIDFLSEMLTFFIDEVLPWFIAQMLFIWETLAEGIFNIIDPSGGISAFFAGLFENDAGELFSALFGIINLIGGIVTLIWIGLTFYLFTSPAFQAEGDANRFASEFMSNAFSFHGVYFSILGFNIPIFLPTLIYWFILTILLGYLDWVLGGIVLW